jgi:SAM-dependent methyltransferase
MRKLLKQFAKLCSKNLPINDPIYEFGSLQVSGQEGFADLRSYFPGKKYIGADMRPGLGVDVILDLHKLELASETAGTVLFFETLEHVEYPHKAMEEIYRIMKPKSILIISSVLNFPIHDYPYDYWRFTPACFSSLLKSFDSSFVQYFGKKSFPHTVVGIASKGMTLEFEKNTLLMEGINELKDEHYFVECNTLKNYLKLCSPPILSKLYALLYPEKTR